MLVNTAKTKFLIKPSPYDARDYRYKVSTSPLRQSVDLREWDSVVEDQEALGSCQGNAITNAYELQVKRLYPDKFTDLSRLFVYYNSRALEGTVTEDAGAYLRDGMKVVQKFGICSEWLWPYDINKFDVKPTGVAYADALSRVITQYQMLITVNQMLNAVNNNKPVVIGVTVYDSFNYVSKDDPVIHAPSQLEKDSGSGHAMAIVGYDIPKKLFIVKNSFGTNWGDNGYAWLPFSYVISEVFEKWVFDINDQTPNYLLVG